MNGIFALIQPLFQFVFDPSLIFKNPGAFFSYLAAALIGALIIINPEWAFLANYTWALWILLIIAVGLIGRYTRNFITAEGQQVLINQLQKNLKDGVVPPVIEFKADANAVYDGIRKQSQEREKNRAQ